MDRLLKPLLEALPVGVIVVAPDNSVVAWNARAEDFIACVGRPTLSLGMTMESAHPENYRPGMQAMVEGLHSGRSYPSKCVSGAEGRSFDVSYHGLMGDDGTVLGVAQVIVEKL
jgi:hypothetical protein